MLGDDDQGRVTACRRRAGSRLPEHAVVEGIWLKSLSHGRMHKGTLDVQEFVATRKQEKSQKAGGSSEKTLQLRMWSRCCEWSHGHWQLFRRVQSRCSQGGTAAAYRASMIVMGRI